MRAHRSSRKKGRLTDAGAARGVVLLVVAVIFGCTPVDQPDASERPREPVPFARVSGSLGTLCTSCSFTVEHVTSLGDLSDPELIFEGEVPSVVRLSSGAFVAAPATSGWQLLVYDETGEYRESWGQEGDGPGEFRAISRIARLPGDSILVVDYSRRITILDPSGAYVRSSQLDFMPLMVKPMGSSRWVASTMSVPAAPERIGYPIHLYSADGTFQTALGGDMPVVQSRPSASQRVVVADEEGVWAGRPDRYEIEYWSVSGEQLSVLDRVAEWFPDREVEGAVNPRDEPPSPYLVDLHVDQDGLLWTLSIMADASWAPSDGTGYSFAARQGRFYDTVVEVIDPASGELLASQRFDWSAWSFTTDGLIVGFHEGEFGMLVIDLWRASFTSVQEDAS